MKDLQVIEKKMPVIEINFEELKAELIEKTEHYKNLVVTEDTIPEAKETQKSLAGLRVKLDNERKEVKKIFSAPIVEFENQVKKLIDIIAEAEKPIKDGLDFYEQKRIEEKKELIHQIKNEILGKLPKKYQDMIETPANFTNKTISEKAIKDHFYIQSLTALKKMSDDEKKERQILDYIDKVNEELNLQIEIKRDMFRFDDESDIVMCFGDIERTAKNQKRVEDEYKRKLEEQKEPEPEPEPKPKPEKEINPEPEPEPEKEINAESECKTKNIKVTVNRKQWSLLLEYFLINDIRFEV